MQEFEFVSPLTLETVCQDLAKTLAKGIFGALLRETFAVVRAIRG